MSHSNLHAVTGAFGYSGRYIAARLLGRGHAVRTLTNSLDRQNAFGGRIEAFPLCFEDPLKLTRSLEGVSVLYNTYWVRFNHKTFGHAKAVENTFALFDAAKAAGVERVVHVSITNPSEASELEYFRGKAAIERRLRESGLSHAILRPAVIFGGEDILINNIAWALRRLPVFGVFGTGSYRLQPIHVWDLAELAVEQGARRESCVIDAIGPETFTYRELVGAIGKLIGCERPMLSVSPWLGYLVARLVGAFVGDVMLTREEIKGLMQGLLSVDSPPAGTTRLTDWVREHREQLGRRYTSELARRLDRESAYAGNGSDFSLGATPERASRPAA